MNENVISNDAEVKTEDTQVVEEPKLENVVEKEEVKEEKTENKSLTEQAKEKGLLPLGSVVLMKDAKKKIMITGYSVTSPESGDKVWDYIGCLWPEGLIAPDKNLMFDHKDIKQVFAIGYVDDEQRRFMDFLDNFNKTHNIKKGE